MTPRTVQFYVLGLAPLIVAGELVRRGYGVAGVLLAYTLGAVVWAVVR